MEVGKPNLQSIFNSPNQYEIPVFQRFYVWKKENWEQLWMNILELYEPEMQWKHHFMGSIVVSPIVGLQGNKLQVIDGQQRIITLSLLLCAIRNVAQDFGLSALVSEIETYYLFHKERQGTDLYRVYPRQRDHPHYFSVVHREEAGEGNVKDALTYFTAQILEKLNNESASDGLVYLFNLLKSRLEFVLIILTGENPYRIFKSLNSLGVDLEESDLIRNFVFMHVQTDLEYFDNALWLPLEQHFTKINGNVDSRLLSAFFRDIMMQNGIYIPVASTFEVFEKTHEEIDPEGLVKELHKQAKLYNILRGQIDHSNSAVNSSLAKLRSLDSSTTYPVILKLMNLVSSGALAESSLVRAIELLAGFIIRRYISAESSRPYGRWFVTLCAEIDRRTSPTKSPVDVINEFLISKKFPDDAHFKENLVRFNLYGRDYADALLKSLELAHPHKERADLSNVTTEHIMPQTLSEGWRADLGVDAERVHKQWLNTIGNLTLSAYNTELSNRRFAQKRDWYLSSNLVLNRTLAESQVWTEVQILQRADVLSELAIQIWAGPEN